MYMGVLEIDPEIETGPRSKYENHCSIQQHVNTQS